jgi:hypothetical protein
MNSSLRIVVTGLAATYPFGGVFWDYMQYFLGLARLGHDVLYLEDTGAWCYDPQAATFVEDGGPMPTTWRSRSPVWTLLCRNNGSTATPAARPSGSPGKR